MPVQSFTAFVHSDTTYVRLERLYKELCRRADVAFKAHKFPLQRFRLNLRRWCYNQQSARLAELRKEWDARHA